MSMSLIARLGSIPVSPVIVGELIAEAANQRRPFSFVRAGDGAGLLLGYGQSAPTDDDLRSFTKHFGAAVLQHENILAMKGMLENALLEADVIGLSWAAATDDDLGAKYPDLEKHGIVRIQWLRQWWMQNHARTRAVLSDAHLQWELARGPYWSRLLGSQTRIGLVNASPTLPAKLAHATGAGIDHFRLPDRYVDRKRWADDHGHEQIYPAAFERVSRELRAADLAGIVVLVGAGIMAKAYCQIVKEQGGIALEMGALLDLWDGRSTRPRVLQRMSASFEDFSLK